ncbi:aspartate carbamoyltransferase [Rapidithrix thailandica]|uniref:Aspartate carbamoyltransferase n=1 Tax=Rapidithrix thailandica TaxID=413964 RepID=A0AAW9S406_9BACT
MVKEKFHTSKTTVLDENPLNSDGLYPDPEKLLSKDTINLNILKRLVGQSVISVDQFDKELVLEVCKFAALLESTEIASSHPLDGKIVITAFFEASTRTRLSFESAVLRLDGKIVSIANGNSTGVAKGESLSDIGEMFNAYGDVVVMRHTETESVDEVMSNLRIPLINAGNGSGEHPTQALADWFAILKWKPQLKGEVTKEAKIHLGILGTPGSMRAVNSFLRMSLLFRQGIRKISIVSEMADPLGEELEELLSASGVEYFITNDINEVVSDLDVIYMNSIAFLGDSYRSLDSRFKLHKDSKLKDDAVVLHPLARLDELDPNLDTTTHNLYFTQAHGAVFIRQALFISVLNRFAKLPKEHIPFSE